MRAGLSPACAPSAGASGGRIRRKAPEIAVVLALVLGCITSQVLSGAYISDFAASDDEPAHVVSSLMVRGYLTHGLSSNPVRFAERYYVHFPKVAIGHWPPLFYCVEAAFMLVFGASRATLLGVILLADMLVVVCVYGVARRYGGIVASASAGLVAVAAPAMRTTVISVGPDMLLALLALLAAIAWGRRLAIGRRDSVLAFALLAFACIFTHGRGVFVLLVPLATMLLLKPRALLRARWLITMALFGVALVVAQWLGQSRSISAWTTLDNFVLFPFRVAAGTGWIVVAVSGVGAYRAIRQRDSLLVALTALVSSGWILLSALNSGWAARYLVMVIPAVAVLFGAGIQWLWQSSANRPKVRAFALVGMCIVTAIEWAMPIHKADHGFHRLADEAFVNAPESRISLVAGDPTFEGAFIAQMALRDPAATRVVLRASNALAWSTWAGAGYRLEFPGPRDVASFLDAAHVGLIVIQDGYSRPHMAQLADAVNLRPGEWSPTQWEGSVKLLRRTTPFPPGKPVIRLDMHEKYYKGQLTLDE